jgi:hypothetical protein
MMERVTIAETYVDFGIREARGVSPVYERLALAVARDRELLGLVGTLPPGKRQPNLLFGVVRLMGGPVEDPGAFRAYVVAHWPAIAAEASVRITQTNEAGRCALLLPVLAALPQPLALLEVGASAGLCLYPDRYGYRYGDRGVGDGEPMLECAVNAVDPPLLLRGDLVDDLPALAARAPAGATLVVFHSSVLYHVPAARRAEFVELVRGLPGHWVSIEAPGVVPLAGLPEPPDGAHHNVLALDGVPLAWTRGHGQAMTWFGRTP